VRYANAEADLVAQPTLLLGQRSNNVAHFERHQHRLERRLLDWHGIVEHNPQLDISAWWPGRA
jgi:hypothetical protein